MREGKKISVKQGVSTVRSAPGLVQITAETNKSLLRVDSSSSFMLYYSSDLKFLPRKFKTHPCNAAPTSPDHRKQPCFGRPCFSTVIRQRLVQLYSGLSRWTEMHFLQLPEISRRQWFVWIEWPWSWKLVRQTQLPYLLEGFCFSADKREQGTWAVIVRHSCINKYNCW